MDYSKPLWQISLVEDYSATESAVFICIHHSFTDAGGFLSFMSSVNDEDKRMKVDKSFPKVSFIYEVIMLILGPIYCAYIAYLNLTVSLDKNASAIDELKPSLKNPKGREIRSGKTCPEVEDKRDSALYSARRRIPFDKIRKCYKKLCTDKQRVSFNDYLMGVLSVSLNKWYKIHGVQGAEKVITFGSINTRPPPKKFEDIKIQNESVGIKFRLPIRNNLETAIECCRTNYHSFLSTFAILSYKSMGYKFFYEP